MKKLSLSKFVAPKIAWNAMTQLFHLKSYFAFAINSFLDGPFNWGNINAVLYKLNVRTIIYLFFANSPVKNPGFFKYISQVDISI